MNAKWIGIALTALGLVGGFAGWSLSIAMDVAGNITTLDLRVKHLEEKVEIQRESLKEHKNHPHYHANLKSMLDQIKPIAAGAASQNEKLQKLTIELTKMGGTLKTQGEAIKMLLNERQRRPRRR